MESYQRDFIQFVLQTGVLKFGEFTLKSGRQSPYFFNAGLFNHGRQLTLLGRFYAQAIHHANLPFDVLFGPAYKGIPLVSAASIALYDQHEKDIPWSFNRKESKTHGEGGQVVGHPLDKQRVLLIDDVITAGTAIREAADLIKAHNATLAGVVIALDRQEKGQNDHSAVMEISSQYQIPVISIISLDDILYFLENQAENNDTLKAMKDYRKHYGITTTTN
jgi:orotate phosphoribosyltransferase